MNLIDDLSARGVLDETKTKGLIDTHLAGVDQVPNPHLTHTGYISLS